MLLPAGGDSRRSALIGESLTIRRAGWCRTADRANIAGSYSGPLRGSEIALRLAIGEQRADHSALLMRPRCWQRRRVRGVVFAVWASRALASSLASSAEDGFHHVCAAGNPECSSRQRDCHSPSRPACGHDRLRRRAGAAARARLAPALIGARRSEPEAADWEAGGWTGRALRSVPSEPGCSPDRSGTALQDLGIDDRHTLLVKSPEQSGKVREKLVPLFEAVQQRLAALPGVVAASPATQGLLD